MLRAVPTWTISRQGYRAQDTGQQHKGLEGLKSVRPQSASMDFLLIVKRDFDERGLIIGPPWPHSNLMMRTLFVRALENLFWFLGLAAIVNRVNQGGNGKFIGRFNMGPCRDHSQAAEKRGDSNPKACLAQGPFI